ALRMNNLIPPAPFSHREKGVRRLDLPSGDRLAPKSLLSSLAASLLFFPLFLPGAAVAEDLDYSIEVQTLFEHDDGNWLWFHPRAAYRPPRGESAGQRGILTLQKHLQESDYYSGLSYCLTEDNGKTWTPPRAPRELAWRSEE